MLTKFPLGLLQKVQEILFSVYKIEAVGKSI